MNRFDSFKEACLKSELAPGDKKDDVAFALFSLEDHYKEMTKFIDALEEIIPMAESQPVQCWRATIAVLAWLDHCQSHEPPIRKWLKEFRNTLESIPGVWKELGLEE